MLEERLGEGSTGPVFAARDRVGRETGRVALKVLAGELAGDAEYVDQLETELAALRTIEQSAIVRPDGLVQSAEHVAIVMELVEGASLAATVATEGPLPGSRVSEIVTAVAAALDAAHDAGIVHRDVTPSDVMLTPDGGVRLLGFGLAGDATTAGGWIGDVDYASPERVDGIPLSPAADVYSLACVAFFALAGVPPFRGAPSHVAMSHRHDPLPPTGKKGVDAALAKAAAKDPEWRFAPASAFARSLKAAAVGRSGTPRAAGVAAAAPTAVTQVVPPATRLRPPPPAPSPSPAASRPAPLRPGVVAPDNPVEDDGFRDEALRWIGVGVAGVIVVLLIVIISKLGGGDGSGAAPAAEPAPASTSTTADTTKTATSTTADDEAKVSTAGLDGTPPASEPYSAAAGQYGADIPAGPAWTHDAEKSVEGGVERTVLHGPDGATIWIDAAGRGALGLTPTTDQTGLVRGKFDTANGTGRSTSFRARTPAFCRKVCTQDQVSLSGRTITVLGGPTIAARRATRAISLSLIPLPPGSAPTTTPDTSAPTGSYGTPTATTSTPTTTTGYTTTPTVPSYTTTRSTPQTTTPTTPAGGATAP